MTTTKKQPRRLGTALLLLALAGSSWSCSCNQSSVSKYNHVNKSMIGTPFHAMLEYVHEHGGDESFALVTIAPSSSSIASKVKIGFAPQQILIEDQQHDISDLKGKVIVFFAEGKRIEMLPSNFSFKTVENRVIEMLAELNKPEE